jgi:hypothetical protein
VNRIGCRHFRIACVQLPYTRANATVFRSSLSRRPCKGHGVRHIPQRCFVQKSRRTEITATVFRAKDTTRRQSVSRRKGQDIVGRSARKVRHSCGNFSQSTAQAPGRRACVHMSEPSSHVPATMLPVSTPGHLGRRGTTASGSEAPGVHQTTAAAASPRIDRESEVDDLGLYWRGRVSLEEAEKSEEAKREARIEDAIRMRELSGRCLG